MPPFVSIRTLFTPGTENIIVLFSSKGLICSDSGRISAFHKGEKEIAFISKAENGITTKL